MDDPAASWVSRSTASPPKVFIGGPGLISPGFPLKACGN